MAAGTASGEIEEVESFIAPALAGFGSHDQGRLNVVEGLL